MRWPAPLRWLCSISLGAATGMLQAERTFCQSRRVSYSSVYNALHGPVQLHSSIRSSSSAMQAWPLYKPAPTQGYFSVASPLSLAFLLCCRPFLSPEIPPPTTSLFPSPMEHVLYLYSWNSRVISLRKPFLIIPDHSLIDSQTGLTQTIAFSKLFLQQPVSSSRATGMFPFLNSQVQSSVYIT